MIRAQAPLARILEVLCAEIERQYPGLLCSILLLDADGTTLRHGAAPSLPPEYNQMVNGAQIGPCAGSCGTAAYLKQPVIVSDIANDPLWKGFAPAALQYDLRACWSMPILSQDSGVLGTFAIYYREPGQPDARHLELISHAAQLAGIAIERDHSQAELRAAETRFRTLVERLPAITYVAEAGANAPWHYVSPQIQSILGFTPAEWLSNPMNWMNQIHPDDRQFALEQETVFQKTQNLFKAEYRMFARDGKLLWFRDEGVKLEVDHGKVLMQGVLYDITEHKRLEEQLRHSQKMEAIGQLAGGIAHDFNNLLMLIQIHNERLHGLLQPGHPAEKDAVEIKEAVTRAASLTGRLLAFSRKQILQPKVLDLNVVIADVARMLRRLIRENIELTVQPAPLLGRIKADPSQIEQVVLNLAVNAGDAMPHGGKMTIETQNAELTCQSPEPQSGPPGRYVVLVVRDTGVGMDAQTQARIFEPFFTTKETGKGTGLGLATVYGVVRQSRGWISVDSQPHGGTTFKIYLPRVEEPLDISKIDISVPAKQCGSETILLVEDQEGIREMAREYLERQGYTVIEAADGDEAMHVASRYNKPIHLLVSDLVMPNMGGQELAQCLKSLRPELRVLFMSGYPEHVGLRSEAEASKQPEMILQKPFSLDSLAHNVRSALG
jgi:PAS domain S-box-containing protein